MSWEEILEKARIIIVDDQDANVLLLQRILQRAGFTNLTPTTDSLQALPLYESLSPDLILLDLHMPNLDGFQVLEQLRAATPPGHFLPVLVLTADITPEAKQRALSIGAKDFLTKPFDPTEVMLRIRNLLETRFLHLQIQNQNQILQQRVKLRTRELEATQFELLEKLALAAEFRDDITGQHTQRVGHMSAVVAAALGLSESEIELIRKAAPLHDVGKIGIPDNILLKPGKLMPEEFEIMKSHTTIGAQILSGRRFPLLQIAEEIAISHHERWDGSGYPNELREDEIPLNGRIVSIVDVFDALTHERPYKPAFSVEETITELKRNAGRQFDPILVELFDSILPDILAAIEDLKDPPAHPVDMDAAIGGGSAAAEPAVSTPAPTA